MRTLEILIEENTSGAVRPVEIAADAPVSALVPALVEELHLPEADYLGHRLVYMLRYPSGGRVLSDDNTLAASGIEDGAKLTLDSYIVNGSVAGLMNSPQVQSHSVFYSDVTVADINGVLPVTGKDTSGVLPAVGRKKRRWTRRAVLALGASVLGAGSLGLGYAAYRSLVNGSLVATKPRTVSIKAPQGAPTRIMTPAPAAIPTMAKSVLTFTQHQQPVRSVTWSPDGMMLASGANDAQLLIWNIEGKVSVQQQQAGRVRAVAWSPGGQQLVVGAANQVIFLNPLTGARLARSTNRHTNQVTSLAWSPVNPLRVVSAALDKQAIVWDATTYRPLTTFTRHTAAIEGTSWAMDGQTIGTSSLGGVIRVWNATSGQEAHGYFQDGAIPLRVLAFAPKSVGMLAAGGDDGVVRFWNGLVCQQSRQSQFGAQCRDVPQRLQAHTGAVLALAWSPDGRFLATGGSDGVLAIWYPAQSQTPLLKVTHNGPVLALAWSPDGRRVATASGNTVMVWGLM